MKHTVLLGLLVFCCILSGCNNNDCAAKLNGTWTHSAMTVNYDFANGQTVVNSLGEVEKKPLVMKKCGAEMATFISGDAEITAVFVDDTHIQISKAGGLSLVLEKMSTK